MNQGTPTLLIEAERDWNLSHKDGWFQMVTAPARPRPVRLTRTEIAQLADDQTLRYREERAAWHANLGPIRTPQIEAIFDTLEELCGANRQDGEKVKPAAVLDALPGLGKSTAAIAFGKAFHRDQIALYGPEIHADGGRWDRVPVAYLGLTSKTTMRSLNLMLCRFYGLPGIESANAERLAHRAAGCVGSCKTRLIIVDDVHFLDIASRDGREVANHFKWLANIFPVTFLFVGVGLRARGLLGEGLYGTDAVYSQTARRWSVLDLAPFKIRTRADRATWRSLLLSIERDLILADAEPGIIADALADYLFARSTGHFASLMSLINRGCYRAIRTGTEKLTEDLLEQVRIDEAAESARREIAARIPVQRTRKAGGPR